MPLQYSFDNFCIPKKKKKKKNFILFFLENSKKKFMRHFFASHSLYLNKDNTKNFVFATKQVEFLSIGITKSIYLFNLIFYNLFIF